MTATGDLQGAALLAETSEGLLKKTQIWDTTVAAYQAMVIDSDLPPARRVTRQEQPAFPLGYSMLLCGRQAES